MYLKHFILAVALVLTTTPTFAEQVEIARCYKYPTTEVDPEKIVYLGKVSVCRDKTCDSHYKVPSLKYDYFYTIRKLMLFVIPDGKGGVIDYEKTVDIESVAELKFSLRGKWPKHKAKAVKSFNKDIAYTIRVMKHQTCKD